MGGEGVSESRVEFKVPGKVIDYIIDGGNHIIPNREDLCLYL